MPSHFITDELLDALAQRESRNDPYAVGDKELKHPAYGAYQMRQPAFLDVQSFRPEATEGITDLSAILGQPDQQRTLARAYLEMLNQRYGFKTIEDVLAGYNAGPTAVRKKKVPTATQAYVAEILKMMETP